MKQAYLGDLLLQLTVRAVDLINDERVRALALVTDPAAPIVLRRDEECTAWLQFKIPCAHTILEHIGDGDVRSLTVHNVDKRWLANSRVDENHPYLRIQDPPAAEDRRRRPKNYPIHPRNLPKELQILTHPDRTLRVLESQSGHADPTPDEASSRAVSLFVLSPAGCKHALVEGVEGVRPHGGLLVARSASHQTLRLRSRTPRLA